MIFNFLLFCFSLIYCQSFPWDEINIPLQHIPFFMNSFPDLKTECQESLNCPFKEYLNTDGCWGYEKDCNSKNSYSQPKCPGHHKGWVSTKDEQLQTFYNDGDFGYVKQRRDTIEEICTSKKQDGSHLACSERMEFCRGKNILMDFFDMKRDDPPVRYSMEIFKKGKFGGNCKINQTRLNGNLVHISPLQTWAPEMRYFTELKFRDCDIWVEKPAVIAKIDASVSLYHHFCDFFNMYASLHLNATEPYALMTDNQVLIWESYPYHSNFGIAWKAFTKNPLWNLKTVAGKKICFKNVLFPLLPRMIFGLYYNSPIIWGCEGSGLFHAFSHHMLHRLKIPLSDRLANKIHITILSRKTKHRKILNEDELISALEKEPNLVIKKVEFKHSDSFYEQLKHDQWTDILIGIHGSGLTHLLFLPDWAVVFELYNCGDPNCYQDLARLRGLKYISWERSDKLYPEDEGEHPQLGGAHEKFTNYAFDPIEFVRLVKLAAKAVKDHPEWRKLFKKKLKDEL